MGLKLAVMQILTAQSVMPPCASLDTDSNSTFITSFISNPNPRFRPQMLLDDSEFETTTSIDAPASGKSEVHLHDRQVPLGSTTVASRGEAESVSLGRLLRDWIGAYGENAFANEVCRTINVPRTVCMTRSQQPVV